MRLLSNIGLAVAGFLALADPASAQRVTQSCVGSGRGYICETLYSGYEQQPPVRSLSAGDQATVDARIAKWDAFCKPVATTDAYGVSRFTYADPGCVFGRSEK